MPTLADHAATLLQELPARPPHAAGRPPGPAHSIGLDLLRLILASTATRGILPWHGDATMPAPTNALTGRPTSGINTLVHLVMRAVRPDLALITATPRQWSALGGRPLRTAGVVPYVYYRSLPASPGLAVPVRGELFDLTDIAFRDPEQRSHLVEQRSGAELQPRRTNLDYLSLRAVINADAGRRTRLEQRFPRDARIAGLLIADLAGAYAAAGLTPWHPEEAQPLASLSLIAASPEHLLWIAAEAQRVLGTAAPDTTSRPLRPRFGGAAPG